MKIQSGSFVSINYKLSLDDDKLIEQSEPSKPLEFVVGLGQMMPGVEKQLLEMEAGQQASFVIEAEDAYGARRPEMRDKIPRDKFPEDARLEEGVVFHAATPQGMLRLTIISVNDEEVEVDLNHPLAGERLHFDVEVNSVREATEEELAASKCGSCCSDHGSCGDHGGGCGDHGHGQGCC